MAPPPDEKRVEKAEDRIICGYAQVQYLFPADFGVLCT